MAPWMFASMSHHAASLSETLSAKVTHVRPLPRVYQSVYPERVGSGEGLLAELALVGSFARVFPNVQLQIVAAGELLVAVRAGEHLGVQGDMLAQAYLGGEALAADVALELLRHALLYTVREQFVRHQTGLL